MSTNNTREIDQCSQSIYKGDSSIERTVEEKETCIVESTQRLIKARTVDFKMDLL